MGIEDPDYQVGARFEALDEGVLAAASKLTGYFFAISICLKVRWSITKSVDVRRRRKILGKCTPHIWFYLATQIKRCRVYLSCHGGLSKDPRN